MCPLCLFHMTSLISHITLCAFRRKGVNFLIADKLLNYSHTAVGITLGSSCHQQGFSLFCVWRVSSEEMRRTWKNVQKGGTLMFEAVSLLGLNVMSRGWSELPPASSPALPVPLTPPPDTPHHLAPSCLVHAQHF